MLMSVLKVKKIKFCEIRMFIDFRKANIDKKSLKRIALSNLYSNIYLKNCRIELSNKAAFWFYNSSQLGGYFLSSREICLLS